MKKLIAALLALFVGVVLLGGVAGCSGDKDKDKDKDKTKKTDK